MDFLSFTIHLGFAFTVFGLSSFLTFFFIRHLRAFDVPNERSSHTAVTPRGGGLAIVIAFIVGIITIQIVGDYVPIKSSYFLGFVFSSLIIATLSLYDDFHPVTFKLKLGGQVLSIFIGLSSGLVIDMINLPNVGFTNLGGWAYPLSFIWIFGLTNAYNFVDGLDGIASSAAVIASLFFSYITYQQGSHFIYLASLLLAAASAGFLVFNWPPAKIFMGDVGSTFLGLNFAVMAIIAARYDHSHTSLFVVPLLLFHFIFDTTFTFVRRLLAGDNIFAAHRTHLYQLLNRIGYSHKDISLLYSGMGIIQGISAIWMVGHFGDQSMYIFIPFSLAYFLLARMLISKARQMGLTV